MMYRKLNLWGPPFLWAVIISGLSSVPGLKTSFGIWDFVLRKMGHFVEFGILTLLLWRAFYLSSQKRFLKKYLFLAGGIAVFYACLDELHQRFVLNRCCSFYDVLIDSLGVVLVISIIFLRNNNRTLKKKSGS